MADDRRQSLPGPSPCGRGQRRKPGHEPHKRGLNTKIPLAVAGHGLPSRVVMTEGTRADCTQAGRLIKGISADHLIADKGSETDAMLEQAAVQGINAVIPPKTNRTVPRPYDKDLYRRRPLVENAF